LKDRLGVVLGGFVAMGGAGASEAGRWVLAGGQAADDTAGVTWGRGREGRGKCGRDQSIRASTAGCGAPLISGSFFARPCPLTMLTSRGFTPRAAAKRSRIA